MFLLSNLAVSKYKPKSDLVVTKVRSCCPSRRKCNECCNRYPNLDVLQFTYKFSLNSFFNFLLTFRMVRSPWSGRRCTCSAQSPPSSTARLWVAHRRSAADLCKFSARSRPYCSLTNPISPEIKLWQHKSRHNCKGSHVNACTDAATRSQASGRPVHTKRWVKHGRSAQTERPAPTLDSQKK